MLLKFFALFVFFISTLWGQNTVSGSFDQQKNQQNRDGKDPTNSLPFSLKDSNPDLSYLKIDEVPVTKNTVAWLVQSPGTPVISVNLILKNSGNSADASGKKGLAKLFLTLLDEGTSDMDGAAFKRYLLEHNIELHSDNNLDICRLSLRFPKTAQKEGFHVIRLVLNNLTFPENAVEKMKAQLKINYKQQLENDGLIVQEKMSHVLFEHTPYAESTAEKLQNLDTLSRKDIQDFYKTHITADNLVIGVCGNISKSEVAHYVGEAIKNLPEKSSAEERKTLPPQHLGSRTDVFIDVPQSTVMFAHPFLKRNNPDYYALELAVNIFGGSDFTARLMHSIREKEGLAYGAYAGVFVLDLSPIIYGSVATRTENSERVLGMVKQEWKKLIEQGVSENELAREKKQSIAKFVHRLSGTKNISMMLTILQYYNLGKDFLKNRHQHISAVTTEHVNQALKKYFSSDKVTFVVGGRSGKKQEEKLQGEHA